MISLSSLWIIIDPSSDVIENLLSIDISWKLFESEMKDSWSEGLRDRVWPMVSMWFFLGSYWDLSSDGLELKRASSAGGMNSISSSDWWSDGVLKSCLEEL